jgi:hypothetical protein
MGRLLEGWREAGIGLVEGDCVDQGWSQKPMGGWFEESVLRKVGDGTKTLFWSDPWLGGTPLSARFGRLFDLASTKSRSMAEMFSWVAGRWRGLGCGGDSCWHGRRRY